MSMGEIDSLSDWLSGLFMPTRHELMCVGSDFLKGDLPQQIHLPVWTVLLVCHFGDNQVVLCCCLMPASESVDQVQSSSVTTQVYLVGGTKQFMAGHCMCRISSPVVEARL